MAGMKTILLIDDNEADNVYHDIVLRRHAAVHHVLARESANAALQLLGNARDQWPDIIFVDLNMPGMDGIECIEQLARLAPPAQVRIFLLTSSDAEQDRQRASRLSIIDDYIIKPLTNEIVSRLLSA